MFRRCNTVPGTVQFNVERRQDLGVRNTPHLGTTTGYCFYYKYKEDGVSYFVINNSLLNN